MLNAALSFLNRGTETPKQICRICRDLAEIRTEELCADCAHVKARIHLRITQQPADGDTSKPTQQCMRSGCVCPPCGRRIFDSSPVPAIRSCTDGPSRNPLSSAMSRVVVRGCEEIGCRPQRRLGC